MRAASETTPRIPESLREPFRSALAAASDAWTAEMGERLISLVLFGSVARGDAHEVSDIDLVVVAEGFPRSLRERRQPLLESWERTRATKGLPLVTWNLITKSTEEALAHSPLYLDIVEDGLLVLDRDGFFAKILSEMRQRMRELGTRRIYLDDGSWYWDLKPGFRFGEVVEI